MSTTPDIGISSTESDALIIAAAWLNLCVEAWLKTGGDRPCP